jgi:hypothetical protein
VANPKRIGSADLLATGDVCSRIIAPAIHDDMADHDVARILAIGRERGSQ